LNHSLRIIRLIVRGLDMNFRSSRPQETMSRRSVRPALRVAVACLTLVVLLTLGVPVAGARVWAASGNPALEEPISVELDGLPVEFDVPPLLTEGRTLVPFRLLAEALRCRVEWNEANLCVTAVNPYSSRTVDLWIGQTDARVNGELRALDVPAEIVDGRTLVPLRFFGEALGAAVVWDGPTRSIDIASPRRPMEVLGYYALGNAETSSWTELLGRPYPATEAGLADLVGSVACAWFVLDPATGLLSLTDSYSGQKRPDNWRDVLSACASYGLHMDMMVHWSRTLDGVTDPAIYTFLGNPDAMKKAVEEIAAYAQDFHGVNLDIEGLGQRQTGEEVEATRRNFTHFVGLLATALRSQDKTLTLSLHPLNSWYPGYDWTTLAARADRIVIMAYGYGPFSVPQPLALVTEGIDLALQIVPREKLLLGLVATRSTAGVEGGETPESLIMKIGLAKRRGLAGIALWRLGVWGDDRLTAIRSLISRRSAATP
jgi:hypothetical protein